MNGKVCEWLKVGTDSLISPICDLPKILIYSTKGWEKEDKELVSKDSISISDVSKPDTR